MTVRDAAEEMEIVIDDRRVDRNAGGIDHAGPGHTQQEQQAQHPLLVVWRAGDLGDDVRVNA